MGRVEDKKGEQFGVKFLNFNHIDKTAAGMWANSRRDVKLYYPNKQGFLEISLKYLGLLQSQKKRFFARETRQRREKKKRVFWLRVLV